MAFNSIRLIAVASVLTAVTATAACGSNGPGTVHSGDIVGAWRGSCGADLTFAVGGTASGHDVPIGGTPSSGNSGMWRLEQDVPGESPQYVEFTLNGHEWDNLDITGTIDKLKLVLTIGDPDDNNTCVFTQE